jgi:predicted amidophosphoribosyltransferase
MLAVSDDLCSACEKEDRKENAELCEDCLEHVQAGSIFFIEIENGSEQEPIRTGRTWEIKKDLVQTTISEPMRSVILTLGFTYVTQEMSQTLMLG